MALQRTQYRYNPPNVGTLNTVIEIQDVTRTQQANGEYTEVWTNILPNNGTMYCAWIHKTADIDRKEDGRYAVYSQAYVKLRKINGLTSTCRIRRISHDGTGAKDSDWWYVMGEPEIFGQNGWIDCFVQRKERAL